MSEHVKLEASDDCRPGGAAGEGSWQVFEGDVGIMIEPRS
jgi:hypothetical protein